MRLGLFGGSFDPIHHGHLITATRAAESARLDRVLFMPAAQSPLKHGGPEAPARDRARMVELAVKGDRRFRASPLELKRGGVSYTIDTVRELLKGRPDTLFLILGADAARLLPRWKSIDELRRRVSFLIVSRPGDPDPPDLPGVRVLRVPLVEISSSEIRERIRRGLSVKYLLPDPVSRYIERKGLYRR